MGDFNPVDFYSVDFYDGLDYKVIPVRIGIYELGEFKNILVNIRINEIVAEFKNLLTRIRIQELPLYFKDILSRVKITSVFPSTDVPEWDIKLYRIINGSEIQLSFNNQEVIEIETEQIANREIGNFRIRMTNEPILQDIESADAIEIFMRHTGEEWSKIFTGQVIKAPEELTDEGDRFINVNGNDFGLLLKKYSFTRTYTDATFADIIKDIVDPITKKTGTPSPTEKKITVNNVEGSDIISWEFEDYTYWDAIKELCAKYNYIFYVDENKDLNVFKRGTKYGDYLNEPMLEKYKYYTTVEYIINYQEVIGARTDVFNPENKDDWSETTNNYTGSALNYNNQPKTVYFDVGTPAQAGIYYIKAYTTDTINTALIRYSFSPSADCSNTYKTFKVMRRQNDEFRYKIRLETDASNYYETTEWYHDSVWNEKVVTTNTATGWNITGSPSWNNINSISFNLKYPEALFGQGIFGLSIFSSFDNILNEHFDKMYFEGDRVRAIAYDITSQNKYGYSEGEKIIDESLTLNSQAQAVAEYMVNSYKNPLPVVENAETDFNKLDVKPGRLIQISIPEISDSFIISSIRHSLLEDKNIDLYMLSYYLPSIETELKDLKTRIASLEHRVD